MIQNIFYKPMRIMLRPCVNSHGETHSGLYFRMRLCGRKQKKTVNQITVKETGALSIVFHNTQRCKIVITPF